MVLETLRISWDATDIHIPYKTAMQGYDATSHFETTVDDVLDLYTRITGKFLDLDAKPSSSQE